MLQNSLSIEKSRLQLNMMPICLNKAFSISSIARCMNHTASVHHCWPHPTLHQPIASVQLSNVDKSLLPSIIESTMAARLLVAIQLATYGSQANGLQQFVPADLAVSDGRMWVN